MGRIPVICLPGLDLKSRLTMLDIDEHKAHQKAATPKLVRPPYPIAAVTVSGLIQLTGPQQNGG